MYYFIVTERMRLQIQVAKMGFLCKVTGLWLTKGEGTQTSGVSRAGVSSCWKEQAEVAWASDQDASRGPFICRFVGTSTWLGGSRVDPENAGEILYLIWPLRMPQGPPGGTGKHCWEEGCLDHLAAMVTWPQISSRKWMDGWMDFWFLFLFLYL